MISHVPFKNSFLVREYFLSHEPTEPRFVSVVVSHLSFIEKFSLPNFTL